MELARLRVAMDLLRKRSATPWRLGKHGHQSDRTALPAYCPHILPSWSSAFPGVSQGGCVQTGRITECFQNYKYCPAVITSNPDKSSRAAQQLQGKPAGHYHPANSQASITDLSCEIYSRTRPPNHLFFALRFQGFALPSQQHCPHQQRCCREAFCIAVQIGAFAGLTRSLLDTPRHKQCRVFPWFGQ